MGQKISPLSIRLRFIKTWKSKWFATRSEYAKYVLDDSRIRKTVKEKYGDNSGIRDIIIKRNPQEINLDIQTSKPGILIGRQGKGVQDLKKLLENKTSSKIHLNIIEIKKPDLEAPLVAANIGNQITKRMPHRRAAKHAIEKVMNAGAKGVKVMVSGRLRGAEIARRETYSQGAMPLSSINKNIDYAIHHAQTTYGVIGVKVWIYKGDLSRSEESETKSKPLF